MARKTHTQLRAERWGTPVPPHLKHGTKTWAADIYGCGCALCLPSGKRHGPKGGGQTKTSWERRTARRSRLRGTPVPAGVVHGNSRPARVVYGCECEVCLPSRKQQRYGLTKWQRDLELKERVWGGPVPDHLKHGPNKRAARIYGCDCKVCLPSGKRTAPKGSGMSKTERAKRLRASKRGKPVPADVKHGSYAAKIYRCKCEVCRASEQRARDRRKERLRGNVIGHWHDDLERKVTVVCWPAGGPQVCPVCDEKVGVGA